MNGQKIKNILNHPWALAIGGAIAWPLISGIKDALNSKPVYTSILNTLKWTLDFLSFQIPIWSVLLIAILSVLGFKGYKRRKKPTSPEKPRFTEFLNTEYEFDREKWPFEWDWIFDDNLNGWKPTHFVAKCPLCKTRLEYTVTDHLFWYYCPKEQIRFDFLCRAPSLESIPALVLADVETNYNAKIIRNTVAIPNELNT